MISYILCVAIVSVLTWNYEWWLICLGLFSLKKKIEDAVLRAEMLAPALELEEVRRNKQEKLIRECDLWDDPVKSNEILSKLADSAKVVDALKDIKYMVWYC